MERFFKWLFLSPVVMIGLFVIGLCSDDFRNFFMKTSQRILEITDREIGRSL